MAATKVDARKLELNPSTNAMIFGLMGIGLLTFVLGLFLNAQRVWDAYLISHMLFMGLGVGAMFYLVVHYLAFAGWNVAVRRIPESFASYLSLAAVFQVVLFFGLTKIYPWTNSELMHSDHILAEKAGYFGTGFFILRCCVFFAGLLFFMMKIVGNSVAQDAEGGTQRLLKQKPLSAMYLVFFAPLFTMFTVDVLKSLDPKWFSTMFGVYVFIGFVQLTAAVTIITIHLMKKSGYMQSVTVDHLHDCGKYLFGFTIFWAYIAVSQYLLIWYANLPEETVFYMIRQRGSWVWASLALPLLRFIIPFLSLLPRKAKRTPSYIVKVALIVCVGGYLDIFWLVIPYIAPQGISITIWDVGMFLGFLGAFAFMVRRFLSKHDTIPVKDPFLHETLHHHVI